MIKCGEANPSRTLVEVATLWDSLHKTPQYVESGWPMVRVTDLRRGYLDTSSTVKVTEDAFKEFTKRYRPRSGDSILSRVGSYGITSFVSSDKHFCLGQNTVCISPNRSLVDPYFLYAFLNSPSADDQIESRVGGSSQPTISLKNIGTIELPCPSISVQRTISRMLKAYDDLIENNTRRIAILEEMARRLYEEWFVRFRFPGHEGVPMVESELGLVPQGWSVRTLGDLVEDMRDTVNPDAVAPNTPYVGLEHIPRRSIALADWGQAMDVTSTKLKFREGDILFGKIRPYFHKVAVAPVAGVASSDAIVMRAKSSKDFGLALAVVSSDAFVAHATQTSNGTKMPRANWGVLRQYPVPTPPDELQARFSDFIGKVVATVSNYVLRNRNLRTTRDLLLPKLISGELVVSTLAEPLAQTL